MMDERSACTNFNETWSGRFFVCKNIKAQKIDDTSQMNVVVVVVAIVEHSIKQPEKSSFSYSHTLYRMKFNSPRTHVPLSFSLSHAHTNTNTNTDAKMLKIWTKETIINKNRITELHFISIIRVIWESERDHLMANNNWFDSDANFTKKRISRCHFLSFATERAHTHTHPQKGYMFVCWVFDTNLNWLSNNDNAHFYCCDCCCRHHTYVLTI